MGYVKIPIQCCGSDGSFDYSKEAKNKKTILEPHQRRFQKTFKGGNGRKLNIFYKENAFFINAEQKK